MNETADHPCASYPTRHCTDIRCRKCHARSRWYRRRAWRARKHPSRPKTGRK